MLETHGDNVLPTFHIAGIPVYGDAILAPMDGYSDWPFRPLCRCIS
jgi:tRNA-dihydrouridine synthase